MRPLTIALGDYGLTKPLTDGSVPAASLPLQHVHVDPIIAAMRRMVRGLEFDICEMAFTTYLCARSLGKPITAIPVFLTRNFHHWAIFRDARSGIRSPKDLEGKRVVVNRGYTVTTGLWARGMLRAEYGVALERVTWLPTDDEHVAEYRAPDNVDYAFRGAAPQDLLLSGRAGAAIGDIPHDAPEIQSLIPNAREAGFAYFRRTGVYPLNHGVVIKNAVLEEAPWVAEALVDAFSRAKRLYLARLAAGGDLSAADAAARDLAAVVGDPFPFGLDANRRAIEAMIGFAVDQKIIPKPYLPEELFAPGTLALA